MSFYRYDTADSLIDSETVVTGLFAGNNLLNTFFTSSSGITNGFYLDVYNIAPASSGSSIQFSILFGDVSGSSTNSTEIGQSGKYQSQAIYGQYRNLVYGDEQGEDFGFNGTNIANNIYVLNFARAQYKESLKYDSFDLTLSGSGANALYLTVPTTPLTNFIGSNIYYNLISGSNGVAYSTSSLNYGFILPDLDLVILDGYSLHQMGLVSGSSDVISIANMYNYIEKGASFELQSQETVSSRYFFTRIKNTDFNYTTNPSIIDSNGNIIYSSLVNYPQTFITTVGLYNDNNELLAVAKLSQPLVKDFTKEALVRVKLSY
jgi:hypothetical protein